MWDVIVLIPDHCFSIYFGILSVHCILHTTMRNRIGSHFCIVLHVCFISIYMSARDLLSIKAIVLIQSNFNGSNTFGIMKISSRQG